MARLLLEFAHNRSNTEERDFLIFCPGCKCAHVVQVPRWSWNGSFERPTFSPSLLVRWDEGEKFAKKQCHSFIKDGKIQFLDDSKGILSGYWHYWDCPSASWGHLCPA